MLELTTIESPIRLDANGVVRIGKSRVTLLSVMNAYDSGATAEEIVQDFPALTLADAYATIAYYLQHRAEVDVYLAELRQQSDEAHTANQITGIRERLEARLTPANLQG
jgi:uncharacterized protein (DUF433 family)